MSDPKPVEIVMPPELAEFGELVRKTERSDPKAEDVQDLRGYLEEHPEVWRVFGEPDIHLTQVTPTSCSWAHSVLASQSATIERYGVGSTAMACCTRR